MQNKVFAVFCALTFASIFSGIETSVGGVRVRLFDCLVVVTALYLTLTFFSRNLSINFDLRYLFVVAPYGYLGVFTLFVGSTFVAAKELVQIGEFLLVMMAARLAIESHEKLFFDSLRFGLWVIVVATTLTHLVDGQFTNYKTFGDPKLAFGYVAMLEVIRYRERGAGAIPLAIAISLTILAGDRKGWVGLLVGSISALVLSSRTKLVQRIRVSILSILAVLLLVATIPFVDRTGYIERQFDSFVAVPSVFFGDSGIRSYTYLTMEKQSDRSRLFTLAIALEVIEEEGFSGIGHGKFQQIMKSKGGGEKGYGHSFHNEYLMFAVVGGIVGLTLYVGVIAYLLYLALYSLQRGADSAVRNLSLLLYGSSINLFLGGGAVCMFFLFFPAALILATNSRQQVSTLPYQIEQTAS